MADICKWENIQWLCCAVVEMMLGQLGQRFFFKNTCLILIRSQTVYHLTPKSADIRLPLVQIKQRTHTEHINSCLQVRRVSFVSQFPISCASTIIILAFLQRVYHLTPKNQKPTWNQGFWKKFNQQHYSFWEHSEGNVTCLRYERILVIF